MQQNLKEVIGMWVVAVVWLYLLPTVGLFLVAVAVFATLRLGIKPPTSHGSARLANWRDALAGGLLELNGLILGRADLLGNRQGQAASRLLRIQKHNHVATFAPTGKGKGVGVIVPNLLEFQGSVVVTDIKDGENHQLTAAYRQHTLGQRVYRYDPFEVCGPGGDGFNPLDHIDADAKDFYDQCRDLANMLVVRQGTEHEPHWNDAAEKVIASITAFVCACSTERRDRNLNTVRLLVGSRDRYARAVDAMRQISSHGGVIAQAGDELTWFADKELSSVLTTVNRHLDFLKSPAVARSLTSTTIDLGHFRTATGASLFLCLPTERLDSLPGLYRLMVGSLLRVLARGNTEVNPVLFLLDEVGQMGRMQALEQATTLFRGKGIRLWFFFQSLEQVHTCYGDRSKVILDNIETQQYFGISSYETAEALSKRVGDTTILVDSRNDTTSFSRPHGPMAGPPQAGSKSRSVSVTRSEIGRKLLNPDEILRLPEDTALIFHRNLPVVPATLVRYYEAPEFADYRHASQHHPTAHRQPKRQTHPALHAARAFTVRFLKAAAALTLLGVILMLADPKSDLSQAIERAGKNSATPGVATPARKPAPTPMRPVLVPIDKDNYLMIPGEQYEQYRATPGWAEHPNAQPLRSLPPAPLPEQPPWQRAHPKPQPRQQPLPRPFVPPAPVIRYSGTLATVAEASVPQHHWHGAYCSDPKWCPDPLRCPRIHQPVQSTLAAKEHAHGR